MIHYEVIDLQANHVLLSVHGQDEGIRAVRALVANGRAWDDLDLVEVTDQRRRSVLLRSYESAVRSMMAESQGQPYRAFRTLAEAQATPVAAVSIEGDYGGQIFATCPARLVRCTEERLRRLAEELETRTNATAYAGSAQVVFEPLAIGARVAGGMGGGIVVDGVWVHEEIRQLGWASAVEGILLGNQEELPPPRPDVPVDVREGILRAYDERVDVFCRVFGFREPEYLRTIPVDERRRREQAIVPPPKSYRRWYPSTLRAVVQEAGRPSHLG